MYYIMTDRSRQGEMEKKMEFCKKLRNLREETKESQAQVGAKIGVTTRQYQRFESGDQKPGFDNLRRIADVFQVSVDWLMSRTEKREINH